MLTSALNLLNEYSSSGSEDESVPGPRVSTKRGTPKDWLEEKAPKKKLLPVPSVLSSLYVDKDSINLHEDDPSLHDGRIRSYQHVRGNWTTFVFIPYENESRIPHLTSLVVNIIKECALIAQLKPIEDFHVSLTRTVVLLHHWIDSFKNSVQTSVAGFPRFTLCFDSLEVYTNEEKTRTFIGLRSARLPCLIELVAAMDKCLSEFKLPAFYKDPSFHLSIAWCVGDLEERIRAWLPTANLILDRYSTQYPGLLQMDVTRLECKTGNKRFAFQLMK